MVSYMITRIFIYGHNLSEVDTEGLAKYMEES